MTFLIFRRVPLLRPQGLICQSGLLQWVLITLGSSALLSRKSNLSQPQCSFSLSSTTEKFQLCRSSCRPHLPRSCHFQCPARHYTLAPISRVATQKTSARISLLSRTLTTFLPYLSSLITLVFRRTANPTPNQSCFSSLVDLNFKLEMPSKS